MAERGVLVMAYGSPSSPDDIERYYTHIRRGAPPSPEQLADLRRRYGAIGGVSPLLDRTKAQVEGTQRALDDAEPGRYRVYLGMKHAPPFIEDTVEAMHHDGLLSNTIALALAPHYSPSTIGDYQRRITEAVGRLDRRGPIRVVAVQGFAFDAELVSILAERVQASVAALGCSKVEVLFTAHSLPARILETDDPYPAQVEQSAAAVARVAGVEGWRVAWQSAGRTDEPWLGPDIRDVIPTLRDEGVDGVIVCPIGFVSDHLEVLYDIDIEAKAVADANGLALARTPSLNDDRHFMEILAGAIRETDTHSGVDSP